jgi:hypothetical protein
MRGKGYRDTDSWIWKALVLGLSRNAEGAYERIGIIEGALALEGWRSEPTGPALSLAIQELQLYKATFLQDNHALLYAEPWTPLIMLLQKNLSRSGHA